MHPLNATPLATRYIEPLPGLRVLPESPTYVVRPENVDLVITLEDQIRINACLVVKYSADDVKCFHLARLAYRIASLYEQTYNAKVRQVQFTGHFHFPKIRINT